MRIKTSEAPPLALDWLVAGIEGVLLSQSGLKWQIERYGRLQLRSGGDYSPTRDCAQGSPIGFREHINISFCVDLRECNRTFVWADMDGRRAHGYSGGHDEPLIAVMRCWVASKHGEFVDVPDELL